MKNIKEQILAHFRHDRKFDKGARLYLKIGNNNAFKNQLNHALATGNPSRVLVGQLNEYLADLAGISTHVMMNYLNQPLSPRPVDQIEETDETDLGAVTGGDPAIDPSKNAADTGSKPAAVVVGISDLPKPILQGMKLRDEFPFLAERNCPAVLKNLVGTMLEAYDAYRFAHEDLFAAESFKAEQEATLAVLDNYLENQVIWAELNHFKQKQELLGSHPDVRAEINRLQIDAMSMLDLAKERSNLQKSVSRYRTMIANEKEKAEKADQSKIEGWQQLFNEKDARLKTVEARIENLQNQTASSK